MPYMPLSELISESNYIIFGKVNDMKSALKDKDEEFIYTDVKVSIKDSLKGSLKQNDEIKIRIEGGQVGPLGQWVEDQPEFELNEEVLVFLNEEDNYFYVNGLFQGKYTLKGGKLPYEICEKLNKNLNTDYECAAKIIRDFC